MKFTLTFLYFLLRMLKPISKMITFVMCFRRGIFSPAFFSLKSCFNYSIHNKKSFKICGQQKCTHIIEYACDFLNRLLAESKFRNTRTFEYNIKYSDEMFDPLFWHSKMILIILIISKMIFQIFQTIKKPKCLKFLMMMMIVME